MLRSRPLAAIAALALAALAILVPAAPASADLPPYAADIYQGLTATMHGEPMQQIALEVIARGAPAPEVHIQLGTEIDGTTTWTNIGSQTGYEKITPPGGDYDYYYQADFTVQFGFAGVFQLRALATNEYSQPNNPQASYTTLTVESPYTVTTQPQSQTVDEGDDAFLSGAVSVADWAAGDPRVAIQKANGSGGWNTYYGPVSGATLGLTLPDLAYPDDDQSQYRFVWLTSYNFAVYSDAATITVVPPDSAAAITQQPEDVEIVDGEDASFQAAASGYPVPTVTWEFSADGSTGWTTVPGATDPTLSLTAPHTEGWYRAVFANTADGVAGTATTDAAHLVITTVPTVAWIIAPTTIVSGTRIPFLISFGGRPEPVVSYQMLDGGSWVDIPGASGTFFQSDEVHWLDGPRSFRVGVTNKNGTVWSSTKTVDVTMDSGSLTWTDHTIGVFQIGEPFTDGVTATSVSAVDYSILSGAMPSGVLFDTATGGMSGQPDTAGTGTMTIAATTQDAQITVVLDATVVDAVSLGIDADFVDRATVEGTEFGIQASGLEPGSAWDVTVHSTPVTIADGTVPGDGTLASETHALPALDAGEHHLVLTVVAANGSTKTTQVDFVVGTDGRFGLAPALASTGVDQAGVAGTVALGAGLLGLGALLALVLARLRRGERAPSRR
jgi:hypothetical protein